MRFKCNVIKMAKSFSIDRVDWWDHGQSPGTPVPTDSIFSDTDYLPEGPFLLH
jgi:hypothetical protein